MNVNENKIVIDEWGNVHDEWIIKGITRKFEMYKNPYPIIIWRKKGNGNCYVRTIYADKLSIDQFVFNGQTNIHDYYFEKFLNNINSDIENYSKSKFFIYTKYFTTKEMQSIRNLFWENKNKLVYKNQVCFIDELK